MDEHAIALLEFGKVVDELAQLAVSPQGAELLRSQPIHDMPEEVGRALGLALEFRAILESGAELPAFDFPDIRDCLPRLGKSGVQMEGEELAWIGRSIVSAVKLSRYVSRSPSAVGLNAIAGEIPDLSGIARAIFKLVDADGILRERRIPALASIRDRIRRLREEVDKSAKSLLEDQSHRTYWQTPVPTMRDGRVVLPLKAQFKGRVKGIVHELSSSGSTIFLEPLEIVEANNAITQAENLYRIEVRRILRELSAQVSDHANEIAILVERTATLDSILARARYAVHHSCRRAEHVERMVCLREARHPLLGSSVVPISVTAGAEERILIITGPNTGGKTVSLKTVGLLALMNQFGMEIPAGEGSALGVFEGVYADIGDEQSIEQSLSTFSGHVKNLAAIVQRAGPRSLVLLDELGAGTDPEEGVALAMALLDHFLQAGSIVLSTTHHGILKNYGYTRRGVQNAAMGFDRETLRPTYTILMGVPGESHALEIARRSGVPEPILRNAAAYLGDERTDISNLVANLSDRHRRLAQAEEEHKAKETDLREKRRKTDLKELTLRQKELELRRQGLRGLRDFAESMRKEWDELRERAGKAAEGGSMFAQLSSRIQERIAEEDVAIQAVEEALAPEVQFEITEGMEVLIRRTGRRARILRKDRGKRWVVETETLRLSLLPRELAPAAAERALSSGSMVTYTPSEMSEPPVLQLDLRGMRLEEALKAIERQIDSALIHGLRQFSIVHGKGEGVLQKGVHEYLGSSKVVEDYRFSGPEEGGFGKTWVTLKG